jgi:cobalt ECF transporter T component CbiQ
MSGRAFFSKTLGQDHLCIQDYAEGTSLCGLYAWDPRIKLALLVLAVGTNVVIAHLNLSVFLFVVSLALAIWSKIPGKLFALFFLAPAWATLIVFLGFSAGFGTSPIFSVGPLTFYREGMVQGMAAAARVACDMGWIAAVFLTTPFNRVLDALKWYRVPTILVDTIAMTYRYAFLLIDEFQRMRDAARSRGGLRGYGKAQRSTAMILAQVILRAYDRAGRIQQAMVSRGANAAKQPAKNLAMASPECPNRCDISPALPKESSSILACTNLSFGYFGTQILREISFTVNKGEVVVLCGPNGAGKTTLLKLFSGILRPSQGEILLNGTRLNRKNRNEAFRSVGILSQDPNDQLFCTHVQEDIAYGPKN